MTAQYDKKHVDQFKKIIMIFKQLRVELDKYVMSLSSEEAEKEEYYTDILRHLNIISLIVEEKFLVKAKTMEYKIRLIEQYKQQIKLLEEKKCDSLDKIVNIV